MELEELLPQKPEFTLSKSQKTYRLRLVDFNDHIWIKNKFGSKEALENVMNRLEWEKIILFAYHMLEDKSDFAATKEKIYDDDGIEREALITGPVKLLREMTSLNDSMAVLNAISASIMLSNPVIKDFVKENIADQIDEIKKKLTGSKSSISLQANTVGPLTKSQD